MRPNTIGGPINPTTGKGSTRPASPREERDFREINGLYSKGAYDAALKKLSTFSQKYPQSSLTPQVENIYGLSLLLTRHAAQAVPHFERAIEESSSNPSLRQYIAYNLADAQFEANQPDNAMKTVATIDAESMDRENRLKVIYLRARIHAQKGEHTESARECLAAGKLLLPTTARETRNAVATLLDQEIKLITDTNALAELYQANEDSSLSDAVLFRLGSQELASGQRGPGENHLRALQSRFPESAYYADAASQLAALPAATGPDGQPLPAPVPTASPSASGVVSNNRDTGPVDSHRVGILLPMKGKFAKFGARTLQGIELAFRIFNANEPDSHITLAIEDSGEDAESVVRALDRLVKNHHVVGVIGPLLSKGIEQVSARAEELGVPLISLSRSTGAPAEYVFQAGLTLRLQAREIARFAIEKLGIKRFAIVYPRDKVGEDGMQKFWDEVESLGGTVRGVESYNPGETDFRQAIDKLSGLYYTEARAKELEALAKDRELNKIKKRTRKTEKYFALPPLIDYEAVFIPEEAKVAGQIIPTFAYRDVDKVKFLGTSAWNSTDFVTRAAAAAENSFFIDAFFADSTSPATRKYIQRYRATFNQEPSAMDAVSYDAAQVLETILKGHEGLSRADLKDKLKDAKFNRDLKVLTFKAGKAVEAP